jgi:hypothetical protein
LHCFLGAFCCHKGVGVWLRHRSDRLIR